MGTGRLRVYLRAARPRTLPAGAAPVIVGSGVAVRLDLFSPAPAAACLLAALLIQVGANFANDYSDFLRGADTSERTGEVRVTQAGLLAPRQVKAAAGVAFGLATLIGLYLVAVGGWPVLAIGLASIAAAVTYTGGPWPYGYHALGELFVFVFFGLAGVTGTVFVQGGQWPEDAVWAGAGVGAVTAAILVANNLRDIRTDRAAGKRTLAVVLGRSGTRAEYVGLLGVGVAVPVAGVALLGWPPAVLAALVGLLPAAPAIRRVVRYADRPREAARLDPAVPGTARALAGYALFLAGGLWLG